MALQAHAREPCTTSLKTSTHGGARFSGEPRCPRNPLSGFWRSVPRQRSSLASMPSGAPPLKASKTAAGHSPSSGGASRRQHPPRASPQSPSACSLPLAAIRTVKVLRHLGQSSWTTFATWSAHRPFGWPPISWARLAQCTLWGDVSDRHRIPTRSRRPLPPPLGFPQSLRKSPEKHQGKRGRSPLDFQAHM